MVSRQPVCFKRLQTNNGIAQATCQVSKQEETKQPEKKDREWRFQDGGGWVVDRKAKVKALTKSNGPRIIPSPLLTAPGAQQKRFRFYFLNKQINQTTCQHGAEIHVIHQKWKVYEPYRPSQKRSSEKRIKEEQKAVHDGISCSFKDEGSQTNYPGHGKIG